MNDKQKTTTFVIVGLLALLVGFAPWRRTSSAPTVNDEVGRKLFEAFDNPLSATSMEVIEFNENNSTIKPFKVEQVGGVWSIPSHENYPADAKDHLAEAATALLGVEILGVAATNPGEHEVFGVIDPDINKLKAGATGVGERVVMKDASGNVLADLIVGKEVKDQPGVRYVRIVGKDPVYRVKLDTSKFSTRFEDWIEKDLLKLNTFDIREIDLNDYTVRTGLDQLGRLAVDQAKKSEITLGYDDEKAEWKLLECINYVDRKPTPAPLGENEELNTDKLNDMRNAFDDLKIVDVERKPKGLNGDLSIEPAVAANPDKLQELATSLASTGFLPVALKKDKLTLLSTDGEVIVKLKDGVEYIVRFGQVAGASTTGASDDKTTGLDRYVMITAQLDDSAIPKPELEALPEAEPAAEKAEPVKDEKAADEKDEKTGVAAAGEEKADEKPTDEKPAEEKKAPSEAEAAAKKAELEERRARIEKENQRKQDEYDEKLKQAQKKVDELNARFGDWYYVISDDVYKKIHLTRADVVKKKEVKPGEGDSVGDFNALDQGGLEAPAKKD